MSVQSGYIYILSNSVMPGLVKIGLTRRDARLRALELYKDHTGVPNPFKVEFSIMVNDCERAELEVFAELNEYRISQYREFFKIDIDEAICRVTEAALRYSGHGNGFAVTPYEERLELSDIYELAKATGKHPFVIIAAIRFIRPDEFAPALARYMDRYNMDELCRPESLK